MDDECLPRELAHPGFPPVPLQQSVSLVGLFFFPENFRAQSSERLSSHLYPDVQDPGLQLRHESPGLLSFMLETHSHALPLPARSFLPSTSWGNTTAEVLNLIVPGYKGTTYAAFSVACFMVP